MSDTTDKSPYTVRWLFNIVILIMTAGIAFAITYAILEPSNERFNVVAAECTERGYQTQAFDEDAWFCVTYGPEPAIEFLWLIGKDR